MRISVTSKQELVKNLPTSSIQCQGGDLIISYLPTVVVHGILLGNL